MVRESQLLVLQGVKITNNESELANKREQEQQIMREIVHMSDESGDGAEQVNNFADRV